MKASTISLIIHGVDVDVVYKKVKYLRIGVYPPLGQVRVSAPTRFGHEQVRLAVIERLPWILRQREHFQTVERQSRREMVSGESHVVFGAAHRLQVIEQPGRERVEADADHLLLFVQAGSTPEHRLALLERWLREQLRQAVIALIAVWEQRLQVTVPQWTIRQMKTRWGSCNPQTRRISFNSELARKPPHCLEYIVVHEMAHYFHDGHGDGFTGFMDSHLPDWRSQRRELNKR
ncbi:metal-dependent hydrolase [Rhizocola hellebori]|uniref:Metal-dependent hydrolase n=1 Tax=Rhizocola hellebori TaxID=1392758 RepID=A0A8J3VJ57_9ACTN|nr:SprT family zinc-dependent metalloprotease [Rhizocola hellebori]GIH07751.1 metal-dependent hydrolase [Rhizocola hellebori]